jgi:hypothetical protein
MTARASSSPASLLAAAALVPPLHVLVDAALDAIVDGTLREFLRPLAPRLRGVVLAALREPENAARFARAREFAADMLADETLAIADDVTIPVDRARLMIEARWRRCATLHPAVYGDRKFVEHSGAVELRHEWQAVPRATGAARCSACREADGDGHQAEGKPE